MLEISSQSAETATLLILGGSNAGIKGGWADHFGSLAQENGWRVENQFLGAVGSLYGVMALMKRQREGRAAPQAIVFEYMLNDILLANQRALSPHLVHAALDFLLDYCRHEGVDLFLVCLESRYQKRFSRIGPTARVRRLYFAAARHARANVRLTDVLGRAAISSDYQDEHHLHPSASKSVANRLAQVVGPAMGRRIGGALQNTASSAFCYVDVSQARFWGHAHPEKIESRVFQGTAIDLRRGGGSEWGGEGRLVGALIYAKRDAGFYAICAGPWARRKNAFGGALDILSKQVTLHYFVEQPPQNRRITLSMECDEAVLCALKTDPTPAESPPRTPFAEQSVSVHGLIFWRPTWGWRRMLEAVERHARRYWWARRTMQDGGL